MTAGIVQKNLSQSLSTCYIFIDLVNIIPRKVTVLNCLCFLSWGCTAPLPRGPGQEFFPVNLNRVRGCCWLYLICLPGFFIYLFIFMSIMQRKWFALCVNHTFSRGMRGCRQLGVTRAPPSLIRPGIPAISHRHLQARRIQPLFSSLWPQCYRSSAWPNVAEILKEKGDPCPCLY